MGMDIVELFLAVEPRFGVDIPDGEAETMRTVGMLHDWLVEKRPDFCAPPKGESTPDEIWLIILELTEQQASVKRSSIQPESRWVEDFGMD
jgi:hypothetical protein